MPPDNKSQEMPLEMPDAAASSSPQDAEHGEDDRPLLYIIAGEASGDALGGRLIAAIRRLTDDAVRFAGVGGSRMAEQGVCSPFPISDIAIMGFAELVPHLPRIFQRIRQTRRDIALRRPDMILTIDAPGFARRVVRGLKGKGAPVAHYVAPTVWAYRPERARTLAKLYDHLMTLLPFEPPYFEREGLPSTCVGHSVIEEWEASAIAEPSFRQEHDIPDNVPLLLVLPGSRKGEIRRHMPVFGETVERLATRYPGLQPVLSVTPEMSSLVHEALQKHWQRQPIVVSSREDKKRVYAAADIALAKSGTVTLELALAGIPMVVGYKVSPFSAWAMRHMIRVRFVNLINLLHHREIIPELLQEFCRPELLVDELDYLLENPDERRQQVEKSWEAMHYLGLGHARIPSERAAEVILRLMGFEEEEELTPSNVHRLQPVHFELDADLIDEI